MKIALLIDTLSSGGAQRQLVMLARELKSRGHDVAMCVYMPGRFYAQELQASGVELIELYPTNRLQKLIMVRRWLQQWQPQVLQTFLEMPNLIAELISLFPHSWKVVVSERNVELFATMHKSQKILRRLMRWLHQRADWVTTNSHTNMAVLLHDAPHLKDKTSMIWNMVDLDYFSPSIDTPKQSQNGIVRFLCVASMYPQKNGPRLVEALHLLRQRNIHDFHMRWVGRLDPDDVYQVQTHNEVMRLVQQYQLQNHFTFAGEKANVLSEYHAADALVLVSECEGVPNAVCEGMACQLPVVLSDVADNARMVEQGRTGFLCLPDDTCSIADALQSLIHLPAAQRHAMGEAARKAAEEQFHRQQFIDGYERIYHHLTAPAS